MIILLYGKDTYHSYNKLQEIIAGYKEKNKSGFNLKFSNKEESISDLCNCHKQHSMFNEKRLVIIYEAFSSSSKKDDFIKNYNQMKESSDIFIFYEEKELKKNDRILKKLLAEKKQEKSIMVQEFKLLNNKALFSWIEKEFSKNSVVVQDRAIYRIMEIGEDNLWRIKNEIDKLSLYKKKITEKDVQSMVSIESTANIFNTIDSIAEKNKQKAMLFIYDHLQKGDYPLYILTMIVYQFRNLIIIKDLIDKNIPYNEVKSKSKLHPFVFQKSYRQAEKFTIKELREIFERLFEIDLKTKTGQLEPVLALHLFVFDC